MAHSPPPTGSHVVIAHVDWCRSAAYRVMVEIEALMDALCDRLRVAATERPLSIRLKEQDLVMVQGLQSSSCYNFLLGILGRYVARCGRWEITFLVAGKDPVRVKPKNLLFVSGTKSEWDKPGLRRYLPSCITLYRHTYLNLPVIDIQSLAQQICNNNNIGFVDWTEQIETLQSSGISETNLAYSSIMKCGLNAIKHKDTGFLIRRTPGNSLFFAAYSLINQVDKGRGDERRLCDFIFYINDDFLYMQLGSELEAHQFSCMISNLVRQHSTGEKPRCSICMEEVDNNDPQISIGGDSSFLAICGHNFHQMCIRKWAVEFLKHQLNDEKVTERKVSFPCPMCRKENTVWL